MHLHFHFLFNWPSFLEFPDWAGFSKKGIFVANGCRSDVLAVANPWCESTEGKIVSEITYNVSSGTLSYNTTEGKVYLSNVQCILVIYFTKIIPLK